MKKITIISGSKRVGNTEGICTKYADEFKNHGCEVNLIKLSSTKVDYCDGCLICDETQKCAIKDGFDNIINTLVSSDLIIIGTPTRWRLMSGELKSFIDRLNPLAVTEGYADKNVFIFAVGQNTEDEGSSILDAINSISLFANDAGMNILGTRAYYNLYGKDDYKDNIDDISQKCKDDTVNLMDMI